MADCPAGLHSASDLFVAFRFARHSIAHSSGSDSLAAASLIVRDHHTCFLCATHARADRRLRQWKLLSCRICVSGRRHLRIFDRRPPRIDQNLDRRLLRTGLRRAPVPPRLLRPDELPAMQNRFRLPARQHMHGRWPVRRLGGGRASLRWQPLHHRAYLLEQEHLHQSRSHSGLWQRQIAMHQGGRLSGTVRLRLRLTRANATEKKRIERRCG